MNLTAKLEDVTRSYEAAHAHLDQVRAAYDGPQKEYAETKANLAALMKQIKENEGLLAESKPKMSMELRRSNGERTDAVKNLMRERRDAEELLDELRVIVKEVERRIGNIRITISPIATRYLAAYQSAAENWARLRAYRVLVDFAPQLSEALVRTPQMVHQPFLEENGGKAFSSKGFILGEIGKLLDSHEISGSPYSADLGEFNLGAFTMNEILTPGGTKILLRELQQDDGPV